MSTTVPLRKGHKRQGIATALIGAVRALAGERTRMTTAEVAAAFGCDADR